VPAFVGHVVIIWAVMAHGREAAILGALLVAETGDRPCAVVRRL
jgi:hypothetical protein